MSVGQLHSRGHVQPHVSKGKIFRFQVLNIFEKHLTLTIYSVKCSPNVTTIIILIIIVILKMIAIYAITHKTKHTQHKIGRAHV